MKENSLGSKKTKGLLLFSLLVAALLMECKLREPQQPEKPEQAYQAAWNSLKDHQTPEWFIDGKFGIYCHWGPYSVPAFENEWYSHWMYCNENNPEHEAGKKFYDHHVATYGPLDEFGYKDFIPKFTAEKFDAAEWASLFKRAGAKFAGPVAEHADGFAMWDSDLTRWNAKEMGPKRDILKELSDEIREQDLKFVATYHRQWLFGWFPTWDETTDASNTAYADLYGPKLKKGDFQYPLSNTELKAGVTKYYPLADREFNESWLARIKEVIDKYQPDMVWLDNKVDVIDEQYRKDFLAYYYNQAAENGQEVLATYKFQDFEEGSAVLDLERSRMSEKKEFIWLTDDSIDWKSWSHIENPDYKSANRIIDFLVDVVSKNGCLLLNITPKANGEIPEPVKERLLEIGDWLKINGEAIYGSRPWKIYGEGPAEVIEGHLSENQNPDNTSKDIRFTTRDGQLYITVLDWPSEPVKIKSLGMSSDLFLEDIECIELIGHDKKLDFDRRTDALYVDFPKDNVGAHAFVLKVHTKA